MKEHKNLTSSNGKKAQNNPVAAPSFGVLAGRKARKICNKLSDAEMREHTEAALDIIYGKRHKKRAVA